MPSPLTEGMPVENYGAAIGGKKPHKDAQQGGFAGTIGAEQRQTFSAIKTERKVVKDAVATEHLAYVVHFEEHGRKGVVECPIHDFRPPKRNSSTSASKAARATSRK